MKKLSFLVVLACFLVTLSGTAFARSDSSEGRPQHYPSSVSIWQENNGKFHIKSTNVRGQHVFTGTIRTDGSFFNINDKQLENGDFIKLDRDRNVIRFRFTGRGIDEVIFKVKKGDNLTFDLNRDGRDMPRKEIYIGKDGWHPRDNKFTLKV